MLAHLLLRPTGRPPGRSVRLSWDGGTSTSPVIVFWPPYLGAIASGEVAERDRLRYIKNSTIPIIIWV